ncbi:histidine kinase [Vibrio sp. qd031]|uniref:cache domain-containing protein n=1 Tax=Vibrio sp. qd031 TaxID=1603038 RepID=UPI000A0F8AF5|nr:cache domain-containing protein [Vibrio sp. qd031]ORT49675.1 histidine kinase [Vibrio sp. qd031]
MPLKTKLFLLTIVPLCIVFVSVVWISVFQMKQLGENEISLFETKMLESREQALLDSADIALAAISHIISDEAIPDHIAQQEVKKILRNLRYSDDGYFFVYDQHGFNLVHPISLELEGRNLLHLKDQFGDSIIGSLLHAAQNGGGYHNYDWQRPSTGKVAAKMSYAVWLDRWDWMIGTGIYIEDIVTDVANMQRSVQSNVNNTFFSLTSIFVISVVLIVLVTLVINVREHRLADSNLKELAHKTVMLQEDEKKHLSRELHDGVNQMLVSSICHLDLAMSRVKDSGDFEQVKHLEGSRNGILSAIKEVRDISHAMRPSALDDIGFLAAINSLLDDFNSHSNIDVSRVLSDDITQPAPEKATMLYRVIQEALTNIDKHAKASRVEFLFQQLGESYQVIVRDNGIGFDRNSLKGNDGIGLRNMRERVEFVGGSFDIDSAKDAGTEISILLDVG